MSDQPGVRFGIANGALVAALLMAGLTGLDYAETATAVVVVAGVACAGLSTWLTATVGLVSWAMFTGFIENSYGELTFAITDVERLAIFVIAVLALPILGQHARLATQALTQD